MGSGDGGFSGRDFFFFNTVTIDQGRECVCVYPGLGVKGEMRSVCSGGEGKGGLRRGVGGGGGGSVCVCV